MEVSGELMVQLFFLCSKSLWNSQDKGKSLVCPNEIKTLLPL